MLQAILAPLLVLALSSTAPGSVQDESREGIVVQSAPSAGYRGDAGVLPGDVLVSWQRGATVGALRWPCGLVEVETEQAPRGAVVLAGRRGGEPMTWKMPAMPWRLRTRPALNPHLRALYREGAERFAARDPEAGAESWLAAVEAATRAQDQQRAAWFLGELGHAWGEAWRWKEADEAYESAVQKAEGTGMAPVLLREWGMTFVRRELWERAEGIYRRALALSTKGSFTAARDLAMLAIIASHRGDLDAAERLYRQSLSARSQLAVTGPYLVQVVREEVGDLRIGNVPREQIDDLRRRLQRLQETLLAEARLPPERPGETAAKTAAAPAKKKEEPSPLETLKQALVKAEQEAPGSLTVSDFWQDLGDLTFAAGDPVGAEIAWLRALDLREKLAPGTLREARTLHDLGRVHAGEGREQAAASFLCRAAAALDRRGRPPVGDDEARTVLGEEAAAYDRDCVEALVAARRPEDAFLALERSHVRGAAFAFSPERLRQRKEIEAERGQLLDRLGWLSTSRDRDEVDLLLSRAADLEALRNAVAGPPDLNRLRAALAPKTVLLAWSLGEEEGLLFAVHGADRAGPGVEVFRVRAGSERLGKRARAFAAATERRDAEAADLYRKLLGPAEDRIAAAEQLLLLPDENLAPLPFGALLRDESLLEKQKSIETAPSATEWAARREALTPSLSPASGKGTSE